MAFSFSFILISIRIGAASAPSFSRLRCFLGAMLITALAQKRRASQASRVGSWGTDRRVPGPGKPGSCKMGDATPGSWQIDKQPCP